MVSGSLNTLINYWRSQIALAYMDYVYGYILYYKLKPRNYTNIYQITISIRGDRINVNINK